MTVRSVPTRLAAAAVALGILACQPKPATVDPEDPTIVAQIDSIVKVAMTGASAANAEQALSITTKDNDFTFITGDLMLVGYDSILPRFKDTYSMLQKQTSEVISKRIRVLSPDVAVVTAITEGTYTDKAGFTSEPVGLGSTIIFVRRNGEWRAVHFHQSIAK
jgi:uncharacterized protein (TIGR02246 family)